MLDENIVNLSTIDREDRHAPPTKRKKDEEEEEEEDLNDANYDEVSQLSYQSACLLT